MTTRTRIEKLEKAIPTDGRCPLCGQVKPDPTSQAAAVARLREMGEELIAALLPDCDGDRARALAVARQMAPTLSNYITA